MAEPQQSTAAAAPQIDWGKYQEPTSAPSIDFSKYEPGQATADKEQPSGKARRFVQSLGEGLPGYHADDAFGAIKDVGSGLYHMFSHPVDSANLLYHGVVDPMELTNKDAMEKLKSKGIGNKISGAIEYAESGIPFLGPQLAQAGRQIESGDVAGGLGTTVAAAIPFVAPGAVKGTVAAAEAVPSVVRSGWRKAGNPFGLASTGEELLTQGISPRTSLTQFKPSLERAAGDLKAFDSQSPIKNVHDLNDAIPEIKQKIWSEEVEPALQRQATKPVNMKPVADKVRAQISDEMKTFDEQNAAKLETLASKLEGAKDVTSANSLLKYANGQLESYFQKFPAARRANLMNNPETAGWEAARSELRNQFLSTLEDAGETGVRDARLRYGAFDTLQDAVERRVNVADRAKPMSLGRIVGLAGAPATGGLSLIAGELSNYLNKPDVLVRRGIGKLASAPSRTEITPPISISEAPPAATPLSATGTTGPQRPATLQGSPGLFKGGINPKGIEASTRAMPLEETTQSLSNEIGTMRTKLRAAPENQKVELQQQIDQYQEYLDDLRKGNVSVSTGTSAPSYVYRVRSQGEEGVPIGGNDFAHATGSLTDAHRLMPGRESVTGEPQEIIRINTSKLNRKSISEIKRKGSPSWFKFGESVPESAVQIIK